MIDIAIRDADESDSGAIVALNLAEVEHTSPMDEARLRYLDSISRYHKVATVGGGVAAFLIAMRDGCGYINDNFEWFAARFGTFLYVDRIVVGRDYQSLRLGTLLYNDMFGFAKAMGVSTIACEYNVSPPNEPSRIFHDRFGFREIGTQWLGNGSRKVSLQVAET